ncbi:TPA: hypothetical protein OV554_003653 [Acinetobacter baumannii]|nr:hypothetical protein [Acinetobacter baumannii]
MNELIEKLIEAAKTQDRESVELVVNEIILTATQPPSPNPVSFKILEEMYKAINDLRNKVIEGEKNAIRDYLNNHNFKLGEWADKLKGAIKDKQDESQIIETVKLVQAQIDEAKLDNCKIENMIGVQLLDELQDLTDKLSLSIQPPVNHYQ